MSFAYIAIQHQAIRYPDGSRDAIGVGYLHVGDILRVSLDNCIRLHPRNLRHSGLLGLLNNKMRPSRLWMSLIIPVVFICLVAVWKEDSVILSIEDSFDSAQTATANDEGTIENPWKDQSVRETEEKTTGSPSTDVHKTPESSISKQATEFQQNSGTEELPNESDDGSTNSRVNPNSILEVENDADGEWFKVKCKSGTLLPSGWCVEETAEKWRFVNRTYWRRTIKGISKCLANKHVVFIGDSRTRFQYLSLANAVARGVFPQCVEGLNKTMIDCEMAGRKMGNWNHFYQVTNTILNERKNETELCYCYRGQGWDRVRENRNFVSPSNFGPIHITYLNSVINMISFDPWFPPFTNYSNNTNHCLPGTCRDRPNEVNLTAGQTLTEILPRFNPKVTHVFASGGWKTYDIGCDIVRVEKEYGIKAFFMSTPRNFKLPWNGSDAETQSCSPPIFDRTSMTIDPPPHLYRDPIHPYASMNEEYNMFLLDAICGSKEDSQTIASG